MDILIEEMDGGLWVASLQKGRLDGLEIDPAGEEVRWGSIYRARVKSVNKTMDAVFVDLDGDNTGILYNRDVRLIDKDGGVIKGGSEAIGKLLKPGDYVSVQAKTTYILSEFEDDAAAENKVAKVSMDITLQGRYLIYCPYMPENRVSARIRSKKMRTQLTGMLDEMSGITGCILRSAAADTQTDILRREAEVLLEMWDNIELFMQDDEVGLIMLGPDSVQRMLSDKAGQMIDRIELTTMDHYHHTEDWCQVFAPDLMPKIEPVELPNASDELALFDYRDITGQIEALLHDYVMLPGGGNIIVQETAALVAIDVNKGGDKRPHFDINLEAAREVARQLRLRNLGGMVLVDFLRPKSKKNEEKLIEALGEAVAQDACSVQIHGKTSLGLWELTRNRRTAPLSERFDGYLD